MTSLKKNSKVADKMVSVPASLLREISALLFKAECTAVYDPRNCEYIKLNDIPEDLSDRIETYIKLS